MKAKRFWAACLAILMMLGVSGCTKKPYAEVREERKERILGEMRQHLLERYGEFEYETGPVVLRELNRPSTDECYMHIPRGETEQERDEFRVLRYGNADEGFYYRDNYYWHIIRDEYEAQMEQELAVLFPTCKVFLGVTSLSEELPEEINGQTTLTEAQAIGLPKHMFWIVVDPATMDETQLKALEEEVKTRWNQKESKVSLRIFLPVSQEVYENVGRYNYLDSMDQFIAEIMNWGVTQSE